MTVAQHPLPLFGPASLRKVSLTQVPPHRIQLRRAPAQLRRAPPMLRGGPPVLARGPHMLIWSSRLKLYTLGVFGAVFEKRTNPAGARQSSPELVMRSPVIAQLLQYSFYTVRNRLIKKISTPWGTCGLSPPPIFFKKTIYL